MTSRARPLAAPDTEAAEALSGAFRPRFPWVTGDLQTIRNVLIIELFGQRVQVPPSTLLTLPLEDATGDALVSELNLPESNPRGVVVVIHGLTGCSQSTHMLALTKNLILAGFAVVRLNLRGAGASAPHCTDTYHGGRSEDIRAALKALAVLRPEFDNLPLFMIGVSLGGNVLIKFLAEGPETDRVHGAATVSAPLDLSATSRWFRRPRNMLYQRYLLNRMKNDALRLTLSDAERHAIRSARSVLDFDDRFIAPRFGYRDAEDYYRAVSAQGFLDAVRTPTLLIHAQDDPWVPAASYSAVDWRRNANLRAIVSPGGGHVGFHAAGSPYPWYVTEIVRCFSDRCG